MAPRHLLAILVAALGGLPAAGDGGPPVRLVRHVFVKVDLIGVRPEGNASLGSGVVEGAPGQPGSREFPLDFYAGSGKKLTGLEISVNAEVAGDERFRLVVASTARISGRQGEPISLRRQRKVDLSTGTSFLHLAYESDDRSISLVAAMSVESREVPELVVPTARMPVTFHVYLVQQSKDGPIPLEENVLRTFEGSPATYTRKLAPVSSFAPGGPTGGADNLELTLLPARSTGDILMVEVTLTSRSPEETDPKEVSLIVHKSHAVSRGGTIEIPFGETSGRLFSGYSFLIRPEY